ncbi:hypothetical protein SEA_DELTON_17 [Mycobacterium phage Delton]|uniref:Uncharacterized protein n=1 Tax=Mycobacterium phage Delton TaxID=2530186 RepID=A0A481W7L2_9CAUD|nr:hypothetical protein SEA_DELTON_17 [Mycobacterium phage Delton]
MSRVIPEDRPLSDEDRAWLNERSMGWKVELIDRAYPPGSDKVEDDASTKPSESQGDDDDEEVEVDEDISNYVEDLPNKDAVKERLILEEVEFEDDAKREELNGLLAIHLQEQRNAGKDVELGD